MQSRRESTYLDLKYLLVEVGRIGRPVDRVTFSRSPLVRISLLNTRAGKVKLSSITKFLSTHASAIIARGRSNLCYVERERESDCERVGFRGEG